MFANCVKMLTRDLKVVESQDKAYKVYFHELRNFAQQTFFVKLLVFFVCIISFLVSMYDWIISHSLIRQFRYIPFRSCRSQSFDKLQLGVAGMPRCTM